MKYISLDIETTGLNPEVNQILEIGAYVEDTKYQGSRETRPAFHHYVWYDNYVCEPYAAAMNANIFKKISALRKDDPEGLLLQPEDVSEAFKFFTWKYFGDQKVLFAGKNLGNFDLRFLRRLPGWGVVKAHHRILDPSLHFVDWSKDECPPDLNTCKERAGIKGSVTHEALDDAWDVISLLRMVQCQTQPQ
jgi:oligoribonuclease